MHHDTCSSWSTEGRYQLLLRCHLDCATLCKPLKYLQDVYVSIEESRILMTILELALRALNQYETCLSLRLRLLEGQAEETEGVPAR